MHLALAGTRCYYYDYDSIAHKRCVGAGSCLSPWTQTRATQWRQKSWHALLMLLLILLLLLLLLLQHCSQEMCWCNTVEAKELARAVNIIIIIIITIKVTALLGRDELVQGAVQVPGYRQKQHAPSPGWLALLI